MSDAHKNSTSLKDMQHLYGIGRISSEIIYTYIAI